MCKKAGVLTARPSSQWTRNICITFVQCRTNFDVGPTLYKSCTNGLCLLGYWLTRWVSCTGSLLLRCLGALDLSWLQPTPSRFPPHVPLGRAGCLAPCLSSQSSSPLQATAVYNLEFTKERNGIKCPAYWTKRTTFIDTLRYSQGNISTFSSLNLPLSSSSTTSRELLSQFSTCIGWRWLEVGGKWKILLLSEQ